MTNLNLCLIEDNLGDARIVSEMLEDNKSYNIKLYHESDLENGIKTAIQKKCLLILLDLGLPGCIGTETLSKVMEKIPDVPIIVLTGIDDQELALQAVKLGAQDYLIKGYIDSILLLRSIHYSIERFRLKQEILDSYKRNNFYKDLFSHDVGNILQNFQSSTELLKMRSNFIRNDRACNDIFNILLEQIKRGSRLVSNVRRLSEIESNNFSFNRIDICQIVDKTIESISRTFNHKKINFSVESLENVIFVHANNLLNDVFENIILNAIKHNMENPIEIKIRIIKENRLEKDYVIVEVEDNAVGIPDEFKKNIFDRKSDDINKYSGLGLGLTLVKKIIDTYDGQIWVENRVEGDFSKGSKFLLRLPVNSKKFILNSHLRNVG